jgi:hypothetical protein
LAGSAWNGVSDDAAPEEDADAAAEGEPGVTADGEPDVAVAPDLEGAEELGPAAALPSSPEPQPLSTTVAVATEAANRHGQVLLRTAVLPLFIPAPSVTSPRSRAVIVPADTRSGRAVTRTGTVESVRVSPVPAGCPCMRFLAVPENRSARALEPKEGKPDGPAPQRD